MNILEQEIEEVVWQAILNNQHDELRDRGFPISEDYTYARQFDLNAYGRCDLLGFNVIPREQSPHRREIEIQIIELKKDKVTASTFFQAIRYAKGLQEKFAHEGYRHYTLFFNFILVGKSVDLNGEFIYLTDFFPRLDVLTYNIDLFSGIKFKAHLRYSLNRPAFKNGTKDLFPILKSNLVTNYTMFYSSPVDVSDDLPF